MPSLDRAADSIILGSFVIRLISIPKDALPRRSISISDAVRWYCWVENCSSLRIRPMTVEAVPRTARMIITRISQEGMDANKPRTRTVANERLGAANAGNACAEIRWVTRWSESQYLSSIVFKIHLHCLLCFVPLAIGHNQKWFRNRPGEIKKTPILSESSPRTIAGGQELPRSVAQFSGTVCVEYRLAWTPAFSAWSRVTWTPLKSSRRAIALSLVSPCPYSKPSSHAAVHWIRSQAFGNAPYRQSLSTPVRLTNPRSPQRML